MKVLVSRQVRSYLYDLSFILYEREYFGFLENAEKYIEELFHEIKTSLPLKMKRPAPKYFERYGSKLLFSSIVKNKTTTWYVFFNIYQTKEDTVYLVRYISNNHVIGHLLED